jgi:hypothetical protein
LADAANPTGSITGWPDLSDRHGTVQDMSTWEEFTASAPDLAAAARACFAVRKHCTMATLRRDGAPRISGTEVEFSGGNIWLGSMPGAVKALDLRRDPRFALHSPTVDPPEEDPGEWPGEAKLAGLAIETSDPASVAAPHRFRLDIKEVVHTRVANGQLEIQSWHEGRGLQVRRRS